MLLSSSMALCALTVLGADAPWSPYDHFNEADSSCDVVAAVPGPAGTTLLGTTCNRLEGNPIGPVVAVDAAGHAVTSAFTHALAESLPDDRMFDLSQLLVHRDGWLVSQHSRAPGPYLSAVNYPTGHRLLRLGPSGARDLAFEAAVQAALDQRLKKPWGLLDVAVDAQGQVIFGASRKEDDEAYLKSAPVVVLRFDATGHVVRELKFKEALESLGLGYFEVLTLRPRPDGGLFVGGRFQYPRDASTRFYLLAFDAQWKLDSKFNAPFMKSFGKDQLEIRLVIPDPKGNLWAIGEYQNSHVVRVTSAGALDPSFHPYTLPGTYPQGRFTYPQLAGPGQAGSLWVSFLHLPGKIPQSAEPGLVRLKADGTVDAAVQKAMGRGLWDEGTQKSPEPDAAAMMSLLAPQPDGTVILAGNFNHFDTAVVTSPMRLGADGRRVATWAPKLSTVVPAKPAPKNPKTSAYFTADGGQHFLACKGTNNKTVTLMYVLMADPWGHQPSCLVHLGGDLASPGGGWDDCDARVAKAKADGATCTETKVNPLDMRRH
jgi:hypothetical protein